MANNLDRLFRESLDQFEVSPTPASWEQVQSQIAGKRNKTAFFLKIAAAIVVLIVATISVINFNKTAPTGKVLASAVDHPTTITEAQFSWKIPESHQLKNDPKIEKPVNVPLKNTEAERVQILQFETIMIAGISESKVDAQLPVNLRLKNLPVRQLKEPSIRITYIASNQPDSTKTAKFDQIINYLTNDLSPTEILADIRDVKDNFFSKN